MNSTAIPTDVTEQALRTLESCNDSRIKAIAAAFIQHMHAFVREVKLTPAEWMAGIDILTRTGQKCDALRQEFILLSDVLGISMTVDAVAHERTPPNVTESSALGPFYTDDAPTIAHGETIARNGDGETVLLRGRVLAADGSPVARALVETWETDPDGLYDTQYAERGMPDHRGNLRTKDDGSFAFRATKPVSYSIPTDGPTGEVLRALRRSTMRPAHIHIKIEADGFRPLATALYTAGDTYLERDAVFGAKASLVETYRTASAADQTRWVIERDFVLEPA